MRPLSATSTATRRAAPRCRRRGGITGPISERTTVRNLAAGTSYTFQLRAVTLAGAGAFAATVRVTTPRSTRLSLSVFTRGAAVEGENLTIGVRRSGLPGSDKGLLVVVDIS